MVIHVVRSGDTIYSIARDYGVNPARLAAENGLSAQAALVVGQTVTVQFPDTVHIVRAGETLSSIARRYGVTVRALQRNNRYLLGRGDLRVGDVLVIAYFRAPLGRFFTGGYAYPAIDRTLLQSVLPYLSALTPFTYGIGREGALLPPGEDLTALAAAAGTKTLLHLSTVTEEGTFSNGRAGMVLRSGDIRAFLTEALLAEAERLGYAGADVDFEFLGAEESAAYADFVAQLRRRFNETGRTVTAALAPKTSADQPGQLYEGHDYALLGAAADHVFLMTYEWGYLYGPPMAVAPLPNVEQVVDYALTEIPAGKLILGVPLYGYDWTLPFVQGESRAQSLSNEEAVALARRYGAEIAYDETARAPWFRYRDEAGNTHEVWFEDARSIEEKLRLAARKGMYGVGFWNLDRPFPQNWLVVNGLYDIL